MKGFVFDLQRFAAIIMGGDDDTLVKGTNGPDQISYSGNRVTIRAGDASDKIENSGKNCSINGGAGGDVITNEGDEATIEGGAGNDSITNYDGDKSSLNGGADSDTIDNTGNLVTIIGGEGADSIMNDGQKVLIMGGAGRDVIYNDVYISGGAASEVTIDGGDDDDYIQTYEEGENVSINGGKGSDTVVNGSQSYGGGKNATLVGGKGDDLIVNYDGENTTFKYASGDGNDTIQGFNSTSILQVGNGKATYSKETVDNDIIITVGDGSVLLVGADSLASVNIFGVEVNENSWVLNGTTATYGTATNTLITVKGVKSIEGLSLRGKAVTVSEKSLGTGKVTISAGYTLKLGDSVPISKTEKKWNFGGTTAVYKQNTTKGYRLANNVITYYQKENKDLVTVSGVTSMRGISLKNKVVTVKASSLGTSKVTISDGYTLKLGSNVIKSTTSKAKWVLNDSATAIYRSSTTTEGYKVVNNQIRYVAADNGDSLAAIDGAKSTSGLSVKNKVITLKGKALKNKVTISGGYKFDFDSDYKNSTITGSSDADTIISRGNKLSISGGDGKDSIEVFGSSTTINGGKGNDTLISSGSKNVFIYKAGDGNDVIFDFAATDTLSISGSVAQGINSGLDVVFTVGSDKITLKGAADKKFTYSDDDGEHSYPDIDEPVSISDDGKSVTVSSIYMSDNFDAANYGSVLQTINASAVVHNLKIKGNKLANKITGSSQDDSINGGKGADTIFGGDGNDTLVGGKGNDSLKGGDGDDVFVYSEGEGNDVITDYTEEDKIKITKGTPNITQSGRDYIFTIGTGKITVKDSADKVITYIDAKGFVNYHPMPTVKPVDFDNGRVILSENYRNNSFNLADYDSSNQTVDASKVTRDIIITGNARANLIIGGTKKNTIIGDAGDDTLYGGKGNNVFVYYEGDGDDVILDYGAGDRISLGSGSISSDSAKGNDYVFKIGKGKITLQNAANKEIVVVDSKGVETSYNSSSNVAWFMEDDNNFSDNQLSELVETKTYLPPAQLDSDFDFVKENNFITYSKK